MTDSDSDKANSSLYIGLMSGTSMDGIDCALIDCTADNVTVLSTHEHPMPPATRQRIADISHSGPEEIERLGRLDRELGLLFAEAATVLLRTSPHNSRDIVAIGSHGQTIRHRPPSTGDTPEQSFTLQIGDPNTIAECTGITTVADFRRRDIAAGGEGAPLAPAFHLAAFARDGVNRAIVNIGGIANASILEGAILRLGFDTGPGNTLMDHWIVRHSGERYDQDGAWAAEGEVDAQLLHKLLIHPYLAKTGPRSTGKEAFNLSWLDECLRELPPLEPRDVQATLAEFTAETIVRGIHSSGVNIDETYVCGGGAHNVDLMRRLYGKLGPITLDSTLALGMDPDWVEAAAFAWLAQQTINGLTGNAPVVTGASGDRVLGAIYPGGAGD